MLGFCLPKCCDATGAGPTRRWAPSHPVRRARKLPTGKWPDIRPPLVRRPRTACGRRMIDADALNSAAHAEPVQHHGQTGSRPGLYSIRSPSSSRCRGDAEAFDDLGASLAAPMARLGQTLLGPRASAFWLFQLGREHLKRVPSPPNVRAEATHEVGCPWPAADNELATRLPAKGAPPRGVASRARG